MFIDPKYYPPGYQWVESHHMVEQQVQLLLEHWHSRVAAGKVPFKFKACKQEDDGMPPATLKKQKGRARQRDAPKGKAEKGRGRVAEHVVKGKGASRRRALAAARGAGRPKAKARARVAEGVTDDEENFDLDDIEGDEEDEGKETPVPRPRPSQSGRAVAAESKGPAKRGAQSLGGGKNKGAGTSRSQPAQVAGLPLAKRKGSAVAAAADRKGKGKAPATIASDEAESDRGEVEWTQRVQKDGRGKDKATATAQGHGSLVDKSAGPSRSKPTKTAGIPSEKPAMSASVAWGKGKAKAAVVTAWDNAEEGLGLPELFPEVDVEDEEDVPRRLVSRRSRRAVPSSEGSEAEDKAPFGSVRERHSLSAVPGAAGGPEVWTWRFRESPIPNAEEETELPKRELPKIPHCKLPSVGETPAAANKGNLGDRVAYLEALDAVVDEVLFTEVVTGYKEAHVRLPLCWGLPL